MSNQTDLNVILDGIEERAGRAAIFLYGGNVSNSESAKDVPALVKALRRAMVYLDWSLARHNPHLYAHREAEITAILQASSEPKEKEN